MERKFPVKIAAIDIVIMLGYIIAVSGLGAWLGRKQRSGEEYFLAGRGMSGFIAGIGVLAALLSTQTYLMLPGEMIKYGVGFFGFLLAYPIIYPVMAYVFIPRFFRLPVTSVYEYLEKRFSPTVRTCVAFIFLLTRLTWMAGIVFTASFALSSITGLSPYKIVFLIVLSTTFYATLGGIRGVIWANIVQFMVLCSGALFVLLFVFIKTGTGPFAWWGVLSEVGQTRIEIFSFDPTVRLTLAGVMLQRFFFTVCTHSSDQVVVQRYLTTPSPAVARRSFLSYLVGSFTTSTLLGLCGLALLAYHRMRSPLDLVDFRQQILQSADRIFPNFIAEELPTGVSGLMLAALLASAMSALSSGINSTATVIVVDFLRYIGFQEKERDTVTRAKSVAVVVGLVVVALSIAYTAIVLNSDWNLLEANLRLGTMFTAPTAVAFFVGYFFRRPGSEAGLIGIVVSLLIAIMLVFNKEVFVLQRGISFLWVIPAATLGGLLASLIGGLFFQPASAVQIESVRMRSQAAQGHST